MIRERLVKIIICSTLFSLVTNCSNAIASKLSQHSDREVSTELPKSDRPVTEASNNDEFNRRIGEAANSARAELQSSQNISETEPQPSDTQNALSVDESPQIDRRLSAIAMAVTLAISLVLLWSLFRKRPQERSSEELFTTEEQNELQELNVDLLSQTNDQSKPLGDLQQGDRQLRHKTIWQLAIAGDARNIEFLIELMLQVDPLDRDLISKAIAQILHRSFKPVNDDLFDALQDKNSEIRKSAIDDLTVLYGFVSPMTKQLVQMQQDPDPEVSQAAIQALQQLNLSSRSQPSNHHSGDRLNLPTSKKENTA